MLVWDAESILAVTEADAVALITGDERASTELARLKRPRTVLRDRTPIEASPWRRSLHAKVAAEALIRAGNRIVEIGSDVADRIGWKAAPVPVAGLFLGIHNGPVPTLEAFTAVDVNPHQLILGSGDLPLTAGAPVHVRHLFVDVVRRRLFPTSTKNPNEEYRAPWPAAKWI